MKSVAQETEKEKAVAPGLYKNLSFDDYAAWDAVNASRLNGFAKTPAHVQYEMLHGGKESTPAMDLGWLVHLAVLEPERFAEEVIAPPKSDKRTKVGKAIWAQFEAKHPGAMLVDADLLAKVKAMSDSVLAHETAAEFISKNPGHNEVSIVWEDAEHGLRCKARIDRIGSIGDWPIVGDLKTARSAARRPLERSIHDYGYDVQAVHYLAGLKALYPVPDGNPSRRFIFIVVESEPPYLCAVYELDDSALEEGASKRKRYMKTWRECVERGEWPGYPAGIEYASLPAWAFKNFVDD